jgi:TRAP-type C4-dicarboxylate transport system permease small subunit
MPRSQSECRKHEKRVLIVLAVVFTRTRPHAHVILAEEDLPPAVHKRLRERRAASPLRMLSCGFVMGVFGLSGTELAAQGATIAEWTQPQNLVMVAGMVFSAGIAWQEITQGRRRLAELEKNSISKDTLTAALAAHQHQFHLLAEQQERISDQVAQIYQTLLAK